MKFTFTASINHNSIQNEIANHIRNNVTGNSFLISDDAEDDYIQHHISKLENVPQIFEYESTEGLIYYIYKIS